MQHHILGFLILKIESKKFDEDSVFIKKYLDREEKIKPIVSLQLSRAQAIETFKRAKNENI